MIREEKKSGEGKLFRKYPLQYFIVGLIIILVAFYFFVYLTWKRNIQ